MEEIAKIIANYGLPAGLLVFVLVRVDKTISEMRDEMIKLNERIDQLCERKRK